MVLPDVIGPGLQVVFCGSAAGAESARLGAYYAGPGNKFWPTLQAIGLTPGLVAPAEYASVLDYGIGLTDLCKEASGSDREIGSGGFDVARLQALIAGNAPRAIAFNGVNAGRTALGAFEDYGPQPRDFGGAETWVLPSTSGAANRDWNSLFWRRFGERVRARDDGCPCEHDRRRAPGHRDEVSELATHRRITGALMEELGSDSGKWMRVLRCRRCGRYWAEDSLSSGQVDLFFVFPIETDDPQAWLAAAEPLY
jgi:TDG/mug DNA glycosylase family protein